MLHLIVQQLKNLKVISLMSIAFRTDELLSAHKGASYINPSDILPVDVVLGEVSIAEALAGSPKFDYAVASHVVEHIPDIVSWFTDIATILRPAGTFRLAIPDRRFTFDLLRQETKASEVLNAYAQPARSPTSQCIMDHYLNVRKVDFYAAWDGTIDAEALECYHSVNYAIDAAKAAIPIDNLPDIHCWVFTPRSFLALMKELANLGFLRFACERSLRQSRTVSSFSLLCANVQTEPKFRIVGVMNNIA